jgi:alkanesulfonate monooxygenase SsuD/methylene tetrahydromethanopterin reductase-like flavin-dependent oxidoreductase (luciferase family)
MLPTFRDDAKVLESARMAEDFGFDGVFVFDHIWPLGQPHRPALSAFPVLGAIAAATERIAIGPLVARIGLVPDAVLIAEFRSLMHISGNRVIAGLGTGDSKSLGENLAFGIEPDPPDERRLALRRCAHAVVEMGAPVWVGGGATATTQLAVDLGDRVAANLWDAQPSAVAALVTRCEVTWAGPVAGDVSQVAQWLSELADAGASWAVCVWPRSLEELAQATALIRTR